MTAVVNISSFKLGFGFFSPFVNNGEGGGLEKIAQLNKLNRVSQCSGKALHDERARHCLTAKLVCERIIEKASHDYPDEFEAAFVRFGQISGAKCNGYWNSDEHIAALIKSSQKIGKLPCIRGVWHNMRSMYPTTDINLDSLLAPS